MSLGIAPNRALKLHQIQCVVAAARRGSFRRAAAALNLQQSSVSRCVQELEGHLGAPLFRRSAVGVALTDVGAQFLADAEHALEHLDRAAKLAGAASGAGRNTLRIGAAAIPGSGFLPELLQAFMAACPGHRIALHEAPSQESLLALHAGALDLAVVLQPPRGGLGAATLPLWRETLWLASAAGDAPRDAIALADMAGEGLVLPTGEIGDLILSKLASAPGCARPAAMCRASPETALRLAAMGQGRAIVPGGARSLAPPAVDFRPILTEGLSVFAVRLGRNEKPALRRLLSLARQLMASADRHDSALGGWDAERSVSTGTSLGPCDGLATV